MATRKPLVLVGDQVARLPAGDALDCGDPVFGAVSPSLGVAFQLSTTQALTLNAYVRLVATSTLASIQSGKAEILCDMSNPPTTIRGEIPCGHLGSTLVLGLTQVTIGGGEFRIRVPVGGWVLIRVVADAGAGAAPVGTIPRAFTQSC